MVKKYIQYYYMSVLKEIKDLKKILLNHINKEQKKLGFGIKKGKGLARNFARMLYDWFDPLKNKSFEEFQNIFKIRAIEDANEEKNHKRLMEDKQLLQAEKALQKAQEKHKNTTDIIEKIAKRKIELAHAYMSNWDKDDEEYTAAKAAIPTEGLEDWEDLGAGLSTITNLRKKKGVPVHVVLGEGFPKIRLKKGDGIYDSLKSAYNTTKDVAKKIYSGDTGMPPNVKKILEKYGNQYIKDIKIVRNPVSSAIINALNVASMGAFKKNLNDSPYDKLFHLKLILELQNGIKIAFEKVERVSLTINPKPSKGEEEINVPVNKMITLNEMYNNTLQRMGNLFYPYSSKNNNCQLFALNILEANNLAGEREKNFVKQDTEELFGDDSFIRKLSNTVTDIGARFNVLRQGGKIGVYPAMYEAPDFIKLPPYLQNQALAEDTNEDASNEEQGGNVDFEKINWGSFKKAFYNRQPKYKHLRTLKEYAMYIIDHPKNFTKHTKHRANFYLNILKK